MKNDFKIRINFIILDKIKLYLKILGLLNTRRTVI